MVYIEFVVIKLRQNYKYAFLDILLEDGNKCGTMDFNTNFLAIILDNTLHWKKHIDYAQIIKLNVACYAIRTLKHIVFQETLLRVYVLYFHSIICHIALYFGATHRKVSTFSDYKKKFNYWIRKQGFA